MCNEGEGSVCQTRRWPKGIAKGRGFIARVVENFPNPDSEVTGESRPAVEKVMQAALQLGNTPDTEWTVDGATTVELHPIQSEVERQLEKIAVE